MLAAYTYLSFVSKTEKPGKSENKILFCVDHRNNGNIVELLIPCRIFEWGFFFIFLSFSESELFDVLEGGNFFFILMY